MLLLRPDPGVCVDRQVILRLKIDAAKSKGVDSQHFAEEHQALQVYLEQGWFPSIGDGQREQFEAYSDQLSRVNRSLWELEDEVRELKSLSETAREGQTKRVVSIAFSIPELNDERARLVEKINGLFGITSKEKLYSAASSEQENDEASRTRS